MHANKHGGFGDPHCAEPYVVEAQLIVKSLSANSDNETNNEHTDKNKQTRHTHHAYLQHLNTSPHTSQQISTDVEIVVYPLNVEQCDGTRGLLCWVLLPKDVFIGLEAFGFLTPLAIHEKTKFWGSMEEYGRGMKPKEIDGRAPPGVEPAALLWVVV